MTYQHIINFSNFDFHPRMGKVHLFGCIVYKDFKAFLCYL